MKRNRLFRLVVPISLILALVLAMPMLSGCFPKAAEPAVPAAPAAEPAEPEPEASPEEAEPIKVGGIFALTGYMAEAALAGLNGFEMAVDEINAEGGLLGRPLEIHLFDIGDFAPETHMLAANELAGSEKVDVVIGSWSGWGQDVEAFGRYDVPTFVYDFSDTTTEALREPGNDNVFHVGEGEQAYSICHWDILMELPYEWPNNKIAYIGEDGSWGRGVGNYTAECAEADGWEVVVSEIVPYGTTEWAPILTKVRATEPALLMFEVPSTPELISFFRQFMLAPTPTILDYGWSMNPVSFMREMGEEVDGLLGEPGAMLTYPPPTPETADWLERYLDKYGSASGKTTSAAVADVSYTATMMWAEAVRQVGDPADHGAVVQWLKDNPYEVMPGLRAYDFVDPNILLEADWPLPVVQVQNGQYANLYHPVFGSPYVDYQGVSYEFQLPPWIE